MTDQKETDGSLEEAKLPEIAAVKTKELMLTDGIRPRDLDELTRYASLVQKSRLAPKGFDTLEKVAIGILFNMELGRPIILGLQDLAIINGKCGIYGDASLAMVTASGLMEEGYPISEETGTPYTDDWTFKYTVKRIGRSKETGTWTWLDAKRAGFDAPKTREGKPDTWSPWARFTRRMMQWKSRNFVVRDNFGDVLKGMKTVEDLHDLDPIPLKRQPDGSYSDAEAPGATDLTDLIKENGQKEIPERLCPYCQEDISSVFNAVLKNHPKANHFICPYCDKECKVENGKPIGSFPPDKTARNSDDFKPRVEKEPEKDSTEEDTGIIKEHVIPPGETWKTWRELWIGLRSPGYSTYFHKNRPRFEAAPSELKEEARAKWLKLYPDTPWPLGAAPEPDSEEDEKRNNLKTDAYDSLSSELNNMPQDVVMKAKKDIGFTKILGTLTLEELEALVKRCKELQKAVVDNQRVSMIDEIEGSYKEVEIQSALVKIERASLSGCSLTELGVIYDSLRENEGEDLA